jgi:PBP1b-binding outer membrane lipoprotein LpoB
MKKVSINNKTIIMKKSLLAIIIVTIILTGCRKDEEDTIAQIREQVSTAHYLALGTLQLLPGYSIDGGNSTNENGEFISTLIKLSEDYWQTGDESSLSNQISIQMLQNGDLKFYGWTTYSDDIIYRGAFSYKNVNENKSVIIIQFRSGSPFYITVETLYCQDGDCQKYIN